MKSPHSGLAVEFVLGMFAEWDRLIQYGDADDFLVACDPTRLNIDIVIAILAVTRRIEGRLPSRAEWVARAEVHLRKTEGDERANLLMDGLR